MTSEPKNREPKYDPQQKCRLILTKMLKTIQWVYYPQQNISIDKQMIAFKGRLKFRQYKPAKLTKIWIRVWMAADASNRYVLNFSVYEVSEERNALIHDLGYDIVTKMARPYLNKNHHLFFDNFFQVQDCLNIC